MGQTYTILNPLFPLGVERRRSGQKYCLISFIKKHIRSQWKCRPVKKDFGVIIRYLFDKYGHNLGTFLEKRIIFEKKANQSAGACYLRVSCRSGLVLYDLPFPFSLCLSGREHLKVTTLLASSIISSPVEGFLPLRSFLSFTQNFPKPLIRTSSPFASVAFMISKRGQVSY